MHMSLRSLGWLVVALHPLFTSAGPVYNAQQEGWISSDLARRDDLVERDNVVVYEPAKRKRKRDIHPGEETILQPIPDDLFGLEKRDALDVSRLDLTPECHMTFGAEHGEKGKAFLASMIMSPPNGEKIVMMEKFRKVVKHVSCADKKGHIKVVFHNLKDYEYAEKAWKWINTDKKKSFIMIANDETCGPKAQRYPYRITQIGCNKKILTATLSAKQVPWSSVATDFSVNYGHLDLNQNKQAKRALHQATAELQKRGPLSFSKGVNKNWNLTVGGPGRFNIFTDILQQFPRLVIDCIDCMIRGSVQLRGNITVKHMKVKEAWFDVTPTDLYAKMQLDISYYKADGRGPSFRLEQELAAIGLGPLVIPHIFKLGPQLAWEVGAQVTALGLANVSVGVEASFSNDAYMKVDLKGHQKSETRGLDKTSIKPIFDINSAQVTFGAVAYNQAELGLAFNVLDVIDWTTGLQIKVPVVNANVSAVYSETGVCTQKPGSAKYGLMAQSGISLETWFVLGKFKLFGKEQATPADWFNRKLLGIKWPFYDLCYPFRNLPKVGPSKTVPSGAPEGTVGATTLPSNAFDQSDDMVMPIQKYQNAKGPQEKDMMLTALPSGKAAPTFVPIKHTAPPTIQE